MPRYTVRMSATIYYQNVEIVAADEESAEDKAKHMMSHENPEEDYRDYDVDEVEEIQVCDCGRRK